MLEMVLRNTVSHCKILQIRDWIYLKCLSLLLFGTLSTAKALGKAVRYWLTTYISIKTIQKGILSNNNCN